MKNSPVIFISIRATCCLLLLVASSGSAMAGVVGTQCWINGTLVGGFPPDYVCPGTGGGGNAVNPSQPSYDYEADRQRRLDAERLRQENERQWQIDAERQKQRELEAQRKREELDKKKREDFERSKQEALRSMKAISEGELGLKGSDAGEFGLKGARDNGTPSFGLKETQASARKPERKKLECEWGTLDTSIVDLRCLGLDPNKPITVDPHVVRGQVRAFPAQPDPETFKNANYNKGFEALMRFDAASAAAAVNFFEKAQKERPKDPLVRNGLLLAQDILKARQQKEKSDQAQAAYFTFQSYAAMMMGDNEKARSYIAQARKLNPKDSNAKFVESLAKANMGAEGTYPERRDAYRLVANGLVSISKHNLAGAVGMLEAAQRLQPKDQFIGMFLQELRKYEERR